MSRKIKKFKKIKEIVKKSTPSAREEVLENNVEPSIKRIKIRVIGIGGGGGSIISELSSKIRNASFVAANTDRQALKQIRRNVLRFQFGEDLTHGLGTGMNWEIAQNAAQAEKDKIKKLLTGYDLCIFVVCLGGGTGSGAALIFAKIARSLGNLSYGIFTLPFKFEGERKAQIAKDSLEKLRHHLNAISIIPNERIFQIIERSTPLKNALSLMNKNLADSLEGLIETIYSPGLINIDFADLKTVFEGRGRLTYLNSVIVPSLEKSEELQKSVLSSPLYPYGIRGSRGVLFNIMGERQLLLSEVAQLSKSISDLASQEAKIIFGVSQKKKPELLKNGVKITLLATGCAQKIFPSSQKKRKIKKIPHPSVPAPALNSPKPQKKKKIRKKKIKRLKRVKGGTKRSFGAGRKKIKKVMQKRLIPLGRKKQKKVHSLILSEPKKIEVKIRRSALELKKDIEEAEKEMLEQEKQWETPTFLRRQNQ